MTRLRRTLLPAALAALAPGALPAHAAVPPQSAQFELLLGVDEPGSDLLSSDLVYGIRFGFNAGHLMFEGELAFQSANSDVVEMGTPVHIDYQALLLDLSVGWTFAPQKRVNGMFYGGIGYGNVDADATIDSSSVNGLFDNSATLNLGAGLRVGVTKGSYVRIDVRGRWFNAREDDEFDGEATVAYGWYF